VVHALEELPGVKKASASHPGKMAIVLYDPVSVTIEQMRQALLKAGYVANPEGREGTTLTVSHQDPERTEEHQIKDLICYCFQYTRHDIKQDLMKNGRSLIMERIMKEKKTGGCDCKNLNPKGR